MNQQINMSNAVGIVEGAIDSSPDERLEAWQFLVDTGLVWQLQGSFGRAAVDLIERGLINPPPKTHH